MNKAIVIIIVIIYSAVLQHLKLEHFSVHQLDELSANQDQYWEGSVLELT